MDVVYKITDTVNNLKYIGSKKHYNKESKYCSYKGYKFVIINKKTYK